MRLDNSVEKLVSSTVFSYDEEMLLILEELMHLDDVGMILSDTTLPAV